MIDFKSLIKAGVHFGHQKSRWFPKMAPYIWGFKNDVHLIDVSKTAGQLEKATLFLEGIAAEGKSILWIGTKKPAQNTILTTAMRLNMPYVYHRWIGGTLSNYSQVKKSVTRLLHYEDIIAKSEKYPHYTKKELNTFQKIVDRLKKNVGGIRNLTWPVGAIVIVDIRKEQSALKEAAAVGIPVVALVDTNSDPTLVDYVIPGNDDAPRAIKIIIDYLSEAVQRGQEKAQQKVVEQKKEAEAPIKSKDDDDEQEVKKKTEAKKAAIGIKQKAAKKISAKEKEETEEQRGKKPVAATKENKKE